MDSELNLLIATYKHCLDQLDEINHKVQKVNSSEQVITNHLSQQETKISEDDSPNTDKLNQVFNKLKLDVDAVLSRRRTDENTSKSAVQLYLDKTLWNLFSRTELQNNKLLFGNDRNRRLDKNLLMKLFTTMLEIDRQHQLADQNQSSDEPDKFSLQLHGWMANILAIYLRLCSMHNKVKLLQLLTTTANISAWAIPFIQFNDVSKIEEYIELLQTIFESKTWTEDDYLAVLDQMAIDYTFHKLVIETFITKDDDEGDSAKAIFLSTIKLTGTLMNGLDRLSSMKSLGKRLSQTIIQISIILIEAMSTQKNCQDQIDSFLCQLIYEFSELKANGWYFLPNIPFKALSVDALWDVTIYLLKIKMDEKPISLNQVLNDHLPSISRFQYELVDNQMHGFFMLNCLTNIALCIPSGVDEYTSIDDINNKNTLSACIVTIISYALFTIAFVDKELREVFYKDVRDNFGPICKNHTFIISLLFRWTVQNISVMERMALYLFRSLNLFNWTILNDDLKLLHKLLSSQQPQQQSAEVLLAKYVIEHLNFGCMCCSVDPTISKSQPWHSRKLPFLSYDIHEEIAFILLDACQKFQPLPDACSDVNENKGAIELVGTVTTAVSTYLPIADQILLLKSTYISNANAVATEFINWAWTIALKLKLYDCSVSSRASDIETSITLPFLRLVLNSYNDLSASHSALLIYISFMLSATSRHFLRFESGDGWMKLLTILKRGKAEATIQIFSEIVPSFVYMHGDDFFNDESLVDFLKHMIELKSDPMLKAAAASKSTTGIGLIIGSHIWQAHLIDSVNNLQENQLGFSYVDLVMHSWLKTVFRKSDWMWYPAYVNVIDTLCKLAFTLHRHRLVYHMLVEEQNRMETLKLQTATNSPRITRFIKNMIPASEGGFSSLLNGEYSMLNLKANTFNKGPGIELSLHWFAFEALVMETATENRGELIVAAQNYLTTSQEQEKQLKPMLDLTAIYKLTSHKKPLEYFAIYRWLQHILVLPLDHTLLPLYLQMFFSLYYQQLHDNVTFGYLFFNKRPDLLNKLRDYIASVQTYFGQKINSGDTTINAEVLQQTYYAMWLWLGNEDLGDVRHDLPSHYDRNRLDLCYGKSEQEQPWYHVDLYWLDLINMEQLEQQFLQFPWEGSDKFRLEEENGSTLSKRTNKSLVDDSISLSTTHRRLRLITDESTLVPLTPFVIRDPSITKVEE